MSERGKNGDFVINSSGRSVSIVIPVRPGGQQLLRLIRG